MPDTNPRTDEHIAKSVLRELGVDCTPEEVSQWPPLAKQLIEKLTVRLVGAALTGKVPDQG